jgi:acylphosphatase
MAERRVLARATGRVQGVGYRAWVQDEARRRGLRGWVRNEPDGSVAALLVGPEAAVGAMLNALRVGPRLAAVRDVSVEAVRPDDVPEGFGVRR